MQPEHDGELEVLAGAWCHPGDRAWQEIPTALAGRQVVDATLYEFGTGACAIRLVLDELDPASGRRRFIEFVNPGIVRRGWTRAGSSQPPGVFSVPG